MMGEWGGGGEGDRHALTHTYPHTYSQIQALTHTHTHTYSQIHALTHTYPHTYSQIHALTHTHTHTYSHSLTHALTLLLGVLTREQEGVAEATTRMNRLSFFGLVFFCMSLSRPKHTRFHPIL